VKQSNVRWSLSLREAVELKTSWRTFRRATNVFLYAKPVTVMQPWTLLEGTSCYEQLLQASQRSLAEECRTKLEESTCRRQHDCIFNSALSLGSTKD